MDPRPLLLENLVAGEVKSGKARRLLAKGIELFARATLNVSD
jgi:hypothetical protein